MIALVACIFASTLISLIFKLFRRYGVRNLPAIVVNYFVCVLCGTLFEGAWLVNGDIVSAPWFVLALGLGFFFIGGFNLNALSVQRAGIAVTSVVQRISLLLSVGFAVLVLGDELTFMQAVGIAFGVLAVLLVVRQPKEKLAVPQDFNGLSPKLPGQELHPSGFAPTPASTSSWLLPLTVFLVAGAIESGLAYAERRYDAGASAAYTVTLFLWAGMLGLLFAMIRPKTDSLPRFTWRDVVGGVALGIPNFFSIHLILIALADGLPAATVFPVLNVATIVLGTLLAVAFFGERLSPKQWAGVAIALLSIGLITS